MKHIKRALIVATVGRFLDFEKNDIKLLQSMGYQVYCAANFEMDEEDKSSISGMDVIKCQVDFARTPLSASNIRAYKQLCQLMQKEHFDLVHCHTPVGGVVARLVAAKYRKEGTKVLYTAHGFHFYEGAPLKNWLFFYPIEWICSWLTDVQITINGEDYKRAKKRFHAKKVVYVPGVGINTNQFTCGNIDVDVKREQLNLGKENIMLLSVGELSPRKNHEVVIRALARLKNPTIRYFVCGTGDLEESLKGLVHKQGLDQQVVFLGYRSDISELCQATDLYIFPSKQEGLPVALMEAIACKTPVICSDIRGNNDLVSNSTDMFKAEDVDGLVRCMESKLGNGTREILFANMQSNVDENYRNLKNFELINVEKEMREIYEGCKTL